MEQGVNWSGGREPVFLNFFYFTPTVMLGERVVLLMSGVETARCTSVSHGPAQERYTEMDFSTTALQFIDFLKRKPYSESLNNEVDRAYTPGECDIVLSDCANMYISSAAYRSTACECLLVLRCRCSSVLWRRPGFPVSTWRRAMPSHGQKQRKQLSSMQTLRWFRGKYLHTLTKYFSSCLVQHAELQLKRSRSTRPRRPCLSSATHASSITRSCTSLIASRNTTSK